VARINTLPFQNGVGGKQQCYVRFVCNDPDCPMVIGHKHPHKCVKFTPTDELVMSVYNVLRMWKDQAITKETKADHKITDHCNMIQYVVGQISKGNYGAHSDACPLLNILDRSTWHNSYVVTNVIDKIISPTVIPAVVANLNAAEEEGANGTTEPAATPK
jgi:hypothetical protein